VVSIFVVQASASVLLFMFSLLIGMSVNRNFRPRKTMWISIGRLKWLWFSLLIIYAWFTPGIAVWTTSVIPAPTQQGLQYAAARISALVMLLWMAHLIWVNLDKEMLIGAIYQLLAPLQILFGWAGFRRETVALRLYLTFEQIDSLRIEAQAIDTGMRPDEKLVAMCEHVINEAMPDTRTVNMLVLSPPAAWQWLLPVMAGCLLWYVEHVQ